MPDNFGEIYRDSKPGTLPWSCGTAEPELVKLVVDGTLREGQRVLDLGCGQGTEAVFLAVQGLRVTGVDRQPRAIVWAKALASFYGVRAEFRRADASDLPFPPGRFHAAVDRGLFHHLADGQRDAYAAEVHRVLRPRGLFFLRCFSPDVPGDWGPRRIRREEIRQAFGSRFETLDLAVYPSLGSRGLPIKLWRCLLRKRRRAAGR
ncbi:MAG: class I SAM-dependent methyltransferase [Planctomycetales bacterium]|nr:class I SAM-dependent methyltransferase [Planctomycetales bacterium]